MSGIVDAFERWLPVPRYRFIGGPYDGQTLVVELHKTERGMLAPEVWNIQEPFKLPPVTWKATEVMHDAVTVSRASYRFVPYRRKMNQGHYEFIEQSAKSAQSAC